MYAKTIIHPEIFEKYNRMYCYKIYFTDVGLKNLKNKYKSIQALPAFLHNLLKGSQTPERNLYLENANLFSWTKTRSVFITPNKFAFNNVLIWKNYPYLLKSNQSDGLSLTAWVIDSRLLKKYGWENDEIDNTNSFRQFLINHGQPQNVSPNYPHFKKTTSQEKINELEKRKPYFSYLATILDLNGAHLSLLKDMRDNAYQHLTKNYKVERQQDKIEMFFHFPYPDSTTTLHMHIRVNQLRHPFEKARSFTVDEVINCLEKNENINELILKRGAIHQEYIDILDNVEGVRIEEVKNPYYLLSPEVFISPEIKEVETKVRDKESNYCCALM